MHASLEFLIGLLDQEGPPDVAAEDLEGSHGPALRMWQAMGFLGGEPGANPAVSCPHCGEGVPYRLGTRFVCNRCLSTVDARHLRLWRMDREAFLRWLASELRLRGGVRQIDGCLWQLGTWESEGTAREYFYRQRGFLSEAGRSKLSAYRSAVVLYGLCRPNEAERCSPTCVSLQEMLRLEESLTVMDPAQLLQDRGEVRFDAQSGTVMVGDTWLGEVPVGSKEYHLLLCLSRQLDRFVSYADIKHEVLRQTGGKDSTDEATFCHRLKNRIKEKGWVSKIDLLIATTNKGDGYRLRGHV